MPGKLSREGLTVVITGASSGFGKGMARELAADGANVVLAARRTALIEELAAECGPNAVAVTTDISKESDMEQLMEMAIAAFGQVDVWINNAGLGIIGSFTEIPLADQARLVEVNLLGTMFGSRIALERFKQQNKGILINVSSFVSSVPLPFGAVYTATKFGITALSEGLYQEMELEQRDRICVVHPWVTDTPWTKHAGNYSGHEIALWPVDDPADVIADIIGLIDYPQETLDIGFKVKGTTVSHKLMPDLVEKLNGKFLLKMLERAPFTEKTSGSLFEPRTEGTEVEGNIRQQFKDGN